MRYAPDGKAVTNMSIAESVGKDKTIWYRVAVFGKQAESCNQYLKKGRMVLVEGRLVGDDQGNPRTYQRKDGTTGASFEVNAFNVRFLGGGENVDDVII
jgi:single-strand DNA-binding protein